MTKGDFVLISLWVSRNNFQKQLLYFQDQFVGVHICIHICMVVFANTAQRDRSG